MFLLPLASYCLCGWKVGWVRSRATAETRTALWRGGCSRSRSPGRESGRSECEESSGIRERPPSCRSGPTVQTPWRTNTESFNPKYSCFIFLYHEWALFYGHLIPHEQNWLCELKWIQNHLPTSVSCVFATFSSWAADVPLATIITQTQAPHPA